MFGGQRGRLMPRLQLPNYPPPEFMTVAEAAAYFSVNETMLRNLLNWIQMPILSSDSWGNSMYSREAVRQRIRP